VVPGIVSSFNEFSASQAVSTLAQTTLAWSATVEACFQVARHGSFLLQHLGKPTKQKTVYVQPACKNWMTAVLNKNGQPTRDSNPL